LTVHVRFDTLRDRKELSKGGSAMITFEYRFDILPGKADAYERYVKGRERTSGRRTGV